MTKSGNTAQVHHTVAVDPKIIPLGTKIMIDGHIYTAEDVGASVKSKVIDIWVAQESNSFGVMHKEVYVMK